MTRDELKEIQHNAAIKLIVEMSVQMDYRRSVPLGDERIIRFWDAAVQRYNETMDDSMKEYYDSNGIVPFEQGERE